MDDEMIHYRAVRCELCEARLFDTDAAQADHDREDHIEVFIKCWRCGHRWMVCLAQAGAEGEYAIISSSPGF